MTALSSVYILIFLPLIAAIFCQTVPLKKNYFWFTFACCIAAFLLVVSLYPQILTQKKISNDFHLSLLSLGLEFSLDVLGYFFLLLLIFAKIVVLFFYRFDVEKFLTEKNAKIFYSVFLLNLFALINILLTNNLFNLFVFLEIYAFTFFAISTLSRDGELLKISFRDFCLNSTASLLLLFCFLIVHLLFKKINFDQISADIKMFASCDSVISLTILLFLATAFLIKFFPFWLFFAKIKNNNLVTNFLIAESMFIKSSVGIFLTLKFVYFFFGKTFLFTTLGLDYPLVIFAILLIIFSAIGVYQQKHLQSICIHLCLINLGFIFAAIGLHTLDALKAVFFYMLNFNLVNLFFFVFATFLKRRFGSASLIKISLIKQDHLLLVLPLKLLIFLAAAFPLTPLFFANWNMAYATLNLGFESSLLIALIVANFAYADLATRFIDAIFVKGTAVPTTVKLETYQSYLISLWLLILAICFVVFFVAFAEQLSTNFAHYLLSI